MDGQKSRSIATQRVLMRTAEKLIAKNEIHNISSVAIQRLNILLYTPLGTLVSSIWDESYSS
tara:strand:+ start:377 stop:562 length:186 start_codon:yes stop_codon:yes gene_type:complete